MIINDTIAAISTPAGVGGVALLRISGPKAIVALEPYVGPLPLEKDRRALFRAFKFEGKLVDEVVVTTFRAPHSYTGEDVVELTCHGSVYLQQYLLSLLIQAGLRLAEPGEFTRRAFLNGKLNLSQAEAVADLIDSTNQASHNLAISQLRGGYAQLLEQLRQQLVDLTALLELELDFSDEEVEFASRDKLRSLLADLQHQVSSLCNTFALGNAIKQGVPVAILGAPNVGKSTLLNALLHDERAIVSNIPGTTRDTIEDSLTLLGYLFRIIDTAGIRSTSDDIEQQGIVRSLRAAQQAYIILYLVDASQSEAEVASQLQQLGLQVDLSQKQLLLIINKIDTVSTTPSYPNTLVADTLSLSAREGTHLELLKEKLVNLVARNQAQEEAPLLTNLRHYEALQRLSESLLHVQEGIDADLSADLVAIDLREALYYLGSVTGQVSSDEVLGSIFSRFCIGK